jgi:hypothetical protein
MEVGLKKFVTELGSKAFPPQAVQRYMPKQEYHRWKKMLRAKRTLQKSQRGRRLEK